MKTVIYLQVWTNPSARVWDDVPATRHEVSDPAEVAQLVSNAAGAPVRMTRHIDGIMIGNLNGSYFHPKPQQLYFPTTLYPTQEAGWKFENKSRAELQSIRDKGKVTIPDWKPDTK